MGKQRKQTKNPVRDKIEGMYVPGERKDDTYELEHDLICCPEGR